MKSSLKASLGFCLSLLCLVLVNTTLPCFAHVVNSGNANQSTSTVTLSVVVPTIIRQTANKTTTNKEITTLTVGQPNTNLTVYYQIRPIGEQGASTTYLKPFGSQQNKPIDAWIGEVSKETGKPVPTTLELTMIFY